MREELLADKKREPIAVKNCPKCGSSNIRWASVFDFKYSVFCKDCEYQTKWHPFSLRKAIEEWNNGKKESPAAGRAKKG